MRNRVTMSLISTIVVTLSIIGCGKTEVQIGNNSQLAANETTQETTQEISTATLEEVINSLHAGQSYAYAPICEGENALLVTSYSFDDLEGHQAAIDASIYIEKNGSIEKVTTVQSGGTAYPIAVTADNCLLLHKRNSVQKAHIDKTSGEYIITEESDVNYVEAEDGVYHNYVKDGKEVSTDSSLFDKLSDEYFNSEVLNFTSAGIMADGAPYFAGAVYTAYEGEDLYNVAFYMAFDSETEGHTETPDGMSGLPFRYEVNGEDVVFHFASEDDTAEAKFGHEYASFPTLKFTDGSAFGSDVITLSCIGDTDPETFDAVKYYDNDTNLYMIVKSFDATSLTGDLYRKEKIKKEYVENADEGSFIYSVNGTQFKVVSYEDVKVAIGYSGTDEEFKYDVAGSYKFEDFLVQCGDDDSYYALMKADYEDEYKVVAMMHEEDIMKRIEDNVTFKIKESCEIILQKFVSDGEFDKLEQEYTIGREFKGDNYPQWSAEADEYYMTDGMLVSLGVIDGELYNIVQIYVP